MEMKRKKQRGEGNMERGREIEGEGGERERGGEGEREITELVQHSAYRGIQISRMSSLVK
jgi:hypothetical protein